MSKSTGIILSASGVALANEWYNTDHFNIRIVVAGLGAALFLDAVDKLSPPFATGLATIALLTVIITPINGESPAQTFATFASGASSTTAPKPTTKGKKNG